MALVAHVTPLMIEDDGYERTLVVAVKLYRDGRYQNRYLRRYDPSYTYDEIEADVAGTWELDRVAVQYVWALETVFVARKERLVP